MSRELPVPDQVKTADQVLEIARIWAVDGSQLVSLNPDIWDDPGSWGIMLVDLANHVAKIYESKGLNREKAFQRIIEALTAELKSPTDGQSDEK